MRLFTVLSALFPVGMSVFAASPTFDPNDYKGSDSARINQAITDAKKAGVSFIRIFKRKADSVSPREYWLLDEAIILPDNMTLYLNNCKLKLSDQCRDNFIRSANCVPGKLELDVIRNVHIIGEGNVILEGADHPRSTGDGAKTLGVQKRQAYSKDTADTTKRMTYGTDAGKEGEHQKGDWRNIGILFAYVQDFSIENLKMVNTHCWGISLEFCRKGKVRSIEFQDEEWRVIDGVKERTLNMDGVDLRHGCRDILIEDISGCTGDDLIALTAIASPPRESGKIGSTQYCSGHKDPRENDVFHVMIRNIRGYSGGKFCIIRFLNQAGTRMHHIMVDGVMDTSPVGHHGFTTICIGSPHYKGSAALGETYGFHISNIITNTVYAIAFGAPLKDSVISNVTHFKYREFHRPIQHDRLKDYPLKAYPLENVIFNNIQSFDRIPK